MQSDVLRVTSPKGPCGKWAIPGAPKNSHVVPLGRINANYHCGSKSQNSTCMWTQSFKHYAALAIWSTSVYGHMDTLGSRTMCSRTRTSSMGLSEKKPYQAFTPTSFL